jgi:hypothetical protein
MDYTFRPQDVVPNMLEVPEGFRAPINLTWFFAVPDCERPANCIAPIGPILVFSIR